MLELVINVLFKVVSIIGSIISVPIILILKPFMDLFGFDDFIVFILEFIDTALSYVSFIVVSLHIPLAPLLLLISLSATLLTLTISFRAIIMIRSVWLAFRGSSGGRSIGFDTNQK